MTGDFDEFVNQQIAKSAPTIDWILRRDDWMKHLDGFYQIAEGFLRKYIDQQKVQITWATKEINENYIGSYEVRLLEVKIGPVEVRFDPIGTNLIGVRGRVDLRGPHGAVKFVLVRKAASTPPMISVIVREAPIEVEDEPEPGVEEWAWKISTRPPNIKFIELTEESFLSAIMEVANA